MTARDWECIVLAIALVAGIAWSVIEWGPHAIGVFMGAIGLVVMVFLVANLLRVFIHPSREPWIPLGCYWPDNGRDKKE